MTASSKAEIEIMLCGDVMLGRGIDQILPHPGDPTLFESYVGSALDYVALAERAYGPIPRAVPFDYVWGDALELLAQRRPHLRLVNLETAVTRRGQPEPKGINYRMTPENLPVLQAASIDCCVLANNHVLDWGEGGLLDTLESLDAAGLATVGAGRDAAGAAAPAVLPLRGGARVIILAFASPSSGVPRSWAASQTGPGVNLLAEMSDEAVQLIARQVRAVKQAGDIVILSLHWGGNWGYEVPRRQRRFAHKLIDEAGVDVIHGHSSHHPKAIEVYKGRPILYGCGDFLNDYEGIGGFAGYRGDIVLLYLVRLVRNGALARIDMLPFRIRGFRLELAGEADVDWLWRVLDRECRRLGGSIARTDGALRFVLD